MQFFKRHTLFGLAVCLLAIPLSSHDAIAQYPGLSDPSSGGNSGGDGEFGPVETNVDGGVIPLGATAQVVVRFRNDSGAEIESGFLRLYPSSTVSAAVSMNQCEEEPLSPGAECAVALSVKGLQSGSWRVEMLMSHSGRSRLVASTLSGTVEAGGEGSDQLSSDIESTPSAVDFGSLSDSQALVEPVILRNLTSTPLNINDLYIDASEQAGFGLKSECKRLEAGEACIAIVTWSPQLPGRSSGVLVVKHDGPASLTSVPLTGIYSPETVNSAEFFPRAIPGKGLLVSSQNSIDFGEEVSTASTITVSLVNAGDHEVLIKEVKIAGADNGLNFKGEGCASGTILAPVEACPLTIQWSPTRIGDVFDDIQVTHDGARGVLVLPIRGASTATVSQDQKAIVISGSGSQTKILSSVTVSDVEASIDGSASARPPSPPAYSGPTLTNPETVLDGYKITSFSPSRAIINGPGGSRLVFHDEETVLGGVPWFISIQPNGIEFLYQTQRVLLLFDRSLSPTTRTNNSSDSNSSSSTDDDDDDDS